MIFVYLLIHFVWLSYADTVFNICFMLVTHFELHFICMQSAIQINYYYYYRFKLELFYWLSS